MPKVSLDMPAEILSDIKNHVGDEKKFVSVADADTEERVEDSSVKI